MTNPLTLVPAKYRKYVYAAATIALFLYAVYQSVDGDWKKFAAALVAALITATAHANTDPAA